MPPGFGGLFGGEGLQARGVRVVGAVRSFRSARCEQQAASSRKPELGLLRLVGFAGRVMSNSTCRTRGALQRGGLDTVTLRHHVACVFARVRTLGEEVGDASRYYELPHRNTKIRGVTYARSCVLDCDLCTSYIRFLGIEFYTRTRAAPCSSPCCPQGACRACPRRLRCGRAPPERRGRAGRSRPVRVRRGLKGSAKARLAAEEKKGIRYQSIVQNSY